MSNPYTGLPRTSYWRTGVARYADGTTTIPKLWSPRAPIAPSDRILTVGSCFAQHIGRALDRSGYCWYIPEPAPYGLSPERAKEFHYDLFSFRTGNIYTTSMLRQWLDWALDPASQSTEVWQQDDAFFDPVRPQIEPGGFESHEDFTDARDATLTAIREGVAAAQVFVFTLGLTESWENAETGLVYASCPGTQAGTFDPDRHIFRNMDYAEILADLEAIRDRLRAINPSIRMLLTVSPVPLAATAEPGRHVLISTVASKSILRAVADAMVRRHADVDYFPSYEIVTTPALAREMFQPDRRGVRDDAVDYVMSHFIDALGPAGVDPAPDREKLRDAAFQAAVADADVVCEEMALERHNADRD